jgi:hypothetical protein
MAVEKIDMNPDDMDGENLDFGDEVGGVDADVLEQAAGELGGEDGEDGGDAGGEQQGAAAGAGDTAAQPGKGAPQSIPYDRFAEVNSKRKAAEEAAQAEREARIRLEEQLKYLRQGQTRQQAPAAPAAPAVDIKALTKERNAALLEGDDDRVADIEAQIEAERLRQAEERAFARLQKEREKEQEQAAAATLKQAAAEIIAVYPFLNSASPDADADAIEDVMALRDRNIAKGLAPAEALRKAVERFKPAFDARVGASADTGDAGSQGDPAAASKMRNAKAANQQPPSMSGGMSAGAVPQLRDVNKMTPDDWASLPDSEREKHLV